MTDIPDGFGPSIDWAPLDAALEGHGPDTDPSYWQCRSHKRQEECCMDDHWHAIFDLRARIKKLEERHKRLLHFAHQVAGGEIEASGCRVAARAAVQQDAFGLGPAAPSWHCGRHGLPLDECGVCHGPCDGGMVCVICTHEGSE